MSLTRRRFIQGSGIVLWLPFLESLVPAQAFAQAQQRRKFIGVFSPSGMHMSFNPAQGGQPSFTSNGNWTFANALRPVVEAGHQGNVMFLRGVHSTYGQDPHWQNTAGFLSCKPLVLGPSRPVICGKSFDQMVAEKFPTPLRSMHVGWRPMNRDFSGDHAHYSDRYVDTIAWRADDRPIGNTYSITQLYDTVFMANAKTGARMRAMNAQKKSVLDIVLNDLKSVNRQLASDDKERLDKYTEGVRELERSIAKKMEGTSAINCTPPNAEQAQADYGAHIAIMQKFVAHALQCDIISSATIMYDDGVGDQHLVHPGTGHDHHAYAHLSTGQDDVNRLESINRRHGSFFAQLLSELKGRNQLDQTLVLWGSNMSDGTVHSTDNLPLVLAGGGGDLKFGEDVGAPTNRIAKADIFVELAGLYGMNQITSFGSDSLVSEGKRIGMKR